MTPTEFKAWFDGFTEGLQRLPTKAQWSRIKERVAEIDGKPVTERIYVDRYWPTVHPYYQHRYGPIGSGGVVETYTGSAGQASSGNSVTVPLDGKFTFNASNAMHALGRAEAAQIGGVA